MANRPPKIGVGYLIANYLIRPPLAVLGFILSPVWVLLGLSDKQLALRNQKKLERDVRELLPFLFDEHRGRVVPNQGVPFPPGFDYAFVTVSVDNLLIRFCRGRGDVDIAVASGNASTGWHDLCLVLALLEKKNDPQRWSFVSLRHASRLLEPQMDRLKQAFAEDSGQDLRQRLANIHASDRIAIREAEWEINKRLKI
jgi:hypothetical protein